MSACLRLIESEGIAAVSLRRVAREAGVSPGAPYHHFADRSALLAALSADGFELLATRLIAARRAGSGGVGALSALVQAYVDFARSEPGYFRLMFRPELSEPHKHLAARTAGDAAFDVLTDVVSDCVESGVVARANAQAVLMAVWGLAHGIASLWLDGQLGEEGKLGTAPEQVTAQITRLLESAVTACGHDAEAT
ncbi:TetR/AcrR family transcriptional regulator [Phytoactinopolyspora alkaliphila]|uniref:TetR/AcrR family transcriptional regulator n=2 Tax=Phytoactinopolyspora alkaliphila TaxID=1783498 RepID=A0A6N9YQZ3_9ACTN|nr:TetR/AcrR family transcriptional regulator [Phytoactinopolyspora alkaliphila]NED97367.1 TetR/AcrR family transcriptional regulator [Phytoactinopolyspora alkaliphila]